MWTNTGLRSFESFGKTNSEEKKGLKIPLQQSFPLNTKIILKQTWLFSTSDVRDVVLKWTISAVVPACFFYRWKKKMSSEILLNHTRLRPIMSRVSITHTQSAGRPPDPALHSEWWSWPRLPCCTASRTSAGPSWWSSCGPVGSPPRCKADDWKRDEVLVMNREQVIGPSWPLTWTKPTLQHSGASLGAVVFNKVVVLSV